MAGEPRSAKEIFPNLDITATVPPKTSKFVHEPLSSPTGFRLIKLLSEEGDDIPRCELTHHDLESTKLPPYTAVSYTWSDDFRPNDHRPILVNGKYLNVSYNVWNFLQNYRCTKMQRFLWIDQICIDQVYNKSERTQQIQHMYEIYARATMDVFWIGEPDEHTEAAMDVLSALSELEQTRLKSSDISYPSSEDLLNPIFMHFCKLPPFPSERWESLMHFISRPAFQRAWIIQEIAAARETYVFAGLLMLPFSTLAFGATFVSNCRWDTLLHTVYNVPGRFRTITALKNCYVRHLLKQPQSLELLLASTRRFKSTRPEDKVFALVNLHLAHSETPTPDLLIPNYDKSEVEVFRDVTRHLINQGSLDVLSGIEDQSFREIRELPSWVPDYSVHQGVSILCMPPTEGNLTLYSAAVARPVKVTSDADDAATLTLAGYKIDRVSNVSPEYLATAAISAKIDAGVRMVDLGATYRGSQKPGASAVNAFWRTFLGNVNLHGTSYPVPDSWVDNFAAFVKEEQAACARQHASEPTQGNMQDPSSPAGDLKITGSPRHHDTIDNLVDSSSGLELILRSLGNVDAEKGDSSRYHDTAHYVSWGRSFYVTESGYFGVGPRSTRVGDTVVLLSGGRMPFVIREGEDGNSRIVGETYLHGVMDGELLEEIGDSWADINFV
ncbi:hypothetical protein jhhlp_003035 [Lomentospora prolificans]|uniref:Heterokaryon incompatibility domain-containing protein n=1 Tax=Lomentospora prolificans TaxID=41688 RepID=A0A2N3NFR5_9PEZI|nr:hypothetical protein jhhlp_003035 [Lomentospora prolificans]